MARLWVLYLCVAFSATAQTIVFRDVRLFAGGKSTATMLVNDGGANGTAHALAVTGGVVAQYNFPWAGVMLTPGKSQMSPANLSGKNAISFWARGDGQTYRLMMFAGDLGAAPPTATFVAPAEWKQYRFEFSAFPGAGPSALFGLVWCAGPKPGKFEFRLDEIRFESR